MQRMTRYQKLLGSLLRRNVYSCTAVSLTMFYIHDSHPERARRGSTAIRRQESWARCAAVGETLNSCIALQGVRYIQNHREATKSHEPAHSPHQRTRLQTNTNKHQSIQKDAHSRAKRLQQTEPQHKQHSKARIATPTQELICGSNGRIPS